MRRGTWVYYDGQWWTRAELDAHRLHEASKSRSTVIRDYVRPKRGRWVIRDGKLVEAVPMSRPRSSGPQVLRDYEPYRAVGLPGAPWITRGRAEHRDMLKRHGKVEIGNEYRNVHDAGPRRRPPPAIHDVADAFRAKGIIG